jgi:pimeloyl-ACP methyl ester carboxylesterase
MITDKYRADPRTRIYLSGHSGGTAIAVWALERLPPDVKVDTLLLIASALSPTYDLSPALRRVRGRAYALHSPYDPVLGIGTRMFGTIDGIRTDAAGRVGFTPPPTAADPPQYAKLTTVGYGPGWIRLSNIGDHIGPMMRPFAREVIAPLLQTGVLRQIAGAATRPAATTRTAAEEAQ